MFTKFEYFIIFVYMSILPPCGLSTTSLVAIYGGQKRESDFLELSYRWS